MNEEMMAALRILGASFETLSKQVEGLPRFLSQKLEAHRAEVGEQLARHVAEVAGLRESTAAQLQGFGGQLQVAVESFNAQRDAFGKIIGDNQQATLQAVEQAKEAIAVDLVSVGEAATKLCATLREDMDARINEVRTSCDTLDLHASAKAMGAALEDLRLSVVKNEQSADAIRQQADADREVAKTEIDQLAKEIEVNDNEVAQRFAEVTANATALNETVLVSIREVSEKQAGVAEQIDNVMATSLPRLHDRIKELEGNVDIKLSSKADTSRVEELGLHVTDLQKTVVANLDQALGAATEAASQVSETTLSALVRVQAALAANSDSTIEALQKCDALGQTLLTKVNEADMSQYMTAEAVRGIAAGFEQLLQEHTESIAQHEVSIKAVAGNVEALNPILEGIGKSAEKSEQTFSAIEAELATFKAPAEQMAELETRILNKVGDIKTAAPLEAPVFSLAYEDGKLLVKAQWGDSEPVQAEVPVSIGVSYRGVYEGPAGVQAGDMVTHRGSVWVAKGAPTGEPGEDITAWQLVVKRGSNGKDAMQTRAYAGHEDGRTYHETDFLRLNNRLWQCTAKKTGRVPDSTEINSTQEWTLIGGVQ